MSGTYQDLRVWQKAMDLSVAVYHSTENFPKPEWYGLRAQIRDAAISVPSNIAEGKGRHSDKDFQHFLFIARGSLLELETQLLLAQRPNFLTEEQAIALLQVSGEGCRGINALINSIGAGTMTTASGR